jgi:polyhydroxyalkanoate synthesis regulator phasin
LIFLDFIGLERTKEKSERLSDNLNSSRRRREEEGKKFIDSLLETQTTRLEKEKSTMQEYSDEKQKSRFDYLKDQKYLSDLMSTNASKAASRITSVRRWH